MERKNKNRGYQKLRVWQEAIDIISKLRMFFEIFHTN